MPNKVKQKTTATSESKSNDENRDIATALVAADIEFDTESTMQYEARKKLKTATDGSLVKG